MKEKKLFKRLPSISCSYKFQFLGIETQNKPKGCKEKKKGNKQAFERNKLYLQFLEDPDYAFENSMSVSPKRQK